jgi:hypothetical protein
MSVQSGVDGTSDPLSRCMQSVGSSLALFIDDSGIWSRPGAEEIKLAIADLCTDLRSIFDRAGVILDARDIPAPQAEYPIRFTALHDIELGYLLPQLLQETRGQVAALAAVGETSGEAGDVLREAHSTLRSHADVLEQLLQKRVAAAGQAAKTTSAS